VITRVDANIDFKWGNNTSPIPGVVTNTNWSARWTGTLVPTTTGTYNLALTSDDGSRLYISNTLVIDNWGDHGDQTRWTAVTLTAGLLYSIEVDYYQAAGDSDVRFTWITPPDIAAAVAAASRSNVAIVAVGLSSSEGYDRTDMSLPVGQDALISAVAQANPARLWWFTRLPKCSCRGRIRSAPLWLGGSRARKEAMRSPTCCSEMSIHLAGCHDVCSECHRLSGQYPGAIPRREVGKQ